MVADVATFNQTYVAVDEAKKQLKSEERESKVRFQ